MSIWKQFLYYSFFCILYLLSVVLIVSFITFFHFYLGHPIEAVEEWVFDNGWGIIIFCKIFAFFWIFKFYNQKRKIRTTPKEIFSDNFKAANRETLLILIFFLALGLMFGPKENEIFVFDISKSLISYFLGLLFYLIDIFLLILIRKNNPTQDRNEKIGHLIFAFSFIITAKISFLLVTINSSTGKTNIIIPFLNMLILLFLTNFNKQKTSNLTNPLLFLVFFICPMISIFGWDPIWGSTYSFFENGVLFDSKIYFVVCFFILYYLNIKNLKYVKNILKKE